MKATFASFDRKAQVKILMIYASVHRRGTAASKKLQVSSKFKIQERIFCTFKNCLILLVGVLEGCEYHTAKSVSAKPLHHKNSCYVTQRGNEISQRLQECNVYCHITVHF